MDVLSRYYPTMKCAGLKFQAILFHMILFFAHTSHNLSEVLQSPLNNLEDASLTVTSVVLIHMQIHSNTNNTSTSKKRELNKRAMTDEREMFLESPARGERKAESLWLRPPVSPLSKPLDTA